MKFGILKSRIENCLVESYRKDTLKKNMFVFEELVLKNKSLSTLYFLYSNIYCFIFSYILKIYLIQ